MAVNRRWHYAVCISYNLSHHQRVFIAFTALTHPGQIQRPFNPAITYSTDSTDYLRPIAVTWNLPGVWLYLLQLVTSSTRPRCHRPLGIIQSASILSSYITTNSTNQLTYPSQWAVNSLPSASYNKPVTSSTRLLPSVTHDKINPLVVRPSPTYATVQPNTPNKTSYSTVHSILLQQWYIIHIPPLRLLPSMWARAEVISCNL